LLTAPTHVSVDHLLQLLIEADINPMRAGRLSRVRPSLQDWTIEKRQESHPLWSRTEEARNESERLRKEIVHHKEQLSLRHAMAKTTLNLIGELLYFCFILLFWRTHLNEVYPTIEQTIC
jgi:hypothetical protein